MVTLRTIAPKRICANVDSAGDYSRLCLAFFCEGGSSWRSANTAISSPTIALLQEDESRVAHTVLAGDIVAIERKALDDDGLVEVTWNERVVMMFTQDVRSRGNRVE
jgi:hypothetical protein